MPFIRLSDNYIDHPKFLALSAQAFRLWHEGMAYCRKHQTDGLIPMTTLQGFRYHKATWARELTTPYQPQASPLWEKVEGFGVKVHDYLDWNLSREDEQSERSASAARMRKFRHGRPVASYGVTAGATNADETPLVPDRIGKEEVLKKVRKEDPPISSRSNRIVFDGQRFVIFEWQLDELCKLLGSHAEQFDLHEWFFIADSKAVATGVVRKSRDWWPWVQAETEAEARRRGLPVEGVGAVSEDEKFAALIAKGPSVRP